MRKMRKVEMLDIIWGDVGWVFEREKYLEALRGSGFALEEVMLADKILDDYADKFQKVNQRVLVAVAWLFDMPLNAVVKGKIPVSTAYRWRDCLNKNVNKQYWLASVQSACLPPYELKMPISDAPKRIIEVDTLIGRVKYEFYRKVPGALSYLLKL